MLTVVTPAASARLATLAQVKAELSIYGAESDAYLNGLLDQASAAIAAHCRRTFGLEVLSETIRLTRVSSDLMLARSPVSVVTSVTEAGEVLAAADYELDAGAGLLTRLQADELSRWYPGKIVVAYSAGWTLPGGANANLPADIQRACIQYVTSMHEGRGRDLSIRAETQEGVGSTTYAATAGGAPLAMPAQCEALLSPWRMAA